MLEEPNPSKTESFKYSTNTKSEEEAKNGKYVEISTKYEEPLSPKETSPFWKNLFHAVREWLGF